MAIAAFPYPSFSGTILSSQVIANFDLLRDHYNANAVEMSGNQTIAGVKTFSSAPVCSAGLTVSASGITVTGNSTITGTLGGLTGLTVASGGATITAGGLTVTAGGIIVTAGNLTMGGGQAAAKRVDAGNSGTALELNFNQGNIQKVTMTGNCTFTLSNPVTGATYVLELLQDATGSRTATWPAAVKWEAGTAPTLTTTASRKDVVVLYYNGTNYDAVVYGLNFNDTA